MKTMTKLTEVARSETLSHIQAAQQHLYSAAQASCPLQGWCDLWEEIGDHADKIKALWHKVNDSPLPTGHDQEQ